MSLEPEPTVPHVCVGEVIGVDGGKMWAMHHPGISTGDLWACDADHCNMARVPMTRERCIAVSALMLELAERLPA